MRTACIIDAAWCDIMGVFLRGWVHLYDRPFQAAALRSGEAELPLPLMPRPDVLAAFPDVPRDQACGFAGYLACPPFRPITLRLATAAGPVDVDVMVTEAAGPQAGPELRRAMPMDRFTAEMKARGGTVLEIGARVVGPDSKLQADRFAPECRFIGVDVHPAPGVDIVADAHRLSHSVPPGSVDGVFSSAVLEHLAAPWLVAAEINRVLKPGGLTLHLTPQAYPVHETPNDFWRMSDAGLSVLFGPATGFEVLDAALSAPCQIMPAPEFRYGPFLDMPLYHAFNSAFILARKVADLPPGAVAWPVDGDRARAYPAHDGR